MRKTAERPAGRSMLIRYPAEEQRHPGPRAGSIGISHFTSENGKVLMVLRIITRYIALTMAVLGVMGLLQAGQSPSPPVPAYIGMLAVGLVTVYGLKAPEIGILAAILNLGVVALGIYFVAVTSQGGSPEIRRFLGTFCLIAGGVNATALFLSERKPTETDLNKPQLCPLSWQSIILFWIPIAGLPIAIAAIRKISRSEGKLRGEKLAWVGVAINSAYLVYLVIVLAVIQPQNK